jgi:predicted HD phosphohydrolase
VTTLDLYVPVLQKSLETAGLIDDIGRLTRRYNHTESVDQHMRS